MIALQQQLLRQMVERVVVSPDGTLLRMELLPHFKYLDAVRHHIQFQGEQGGSEENKKAQLGLSWAMTPVGLEPTTN